ncbi:hypothetical protein V6N13_035827 [Hibiscus sabdariffa]
MNFLLPRSNSNQHGTPEPSPRREHMPELSYVPKSVTSLQRLIAEDPLPEYPRAENHGQGNGFLGKNADVASDKNASVIPSHTDVTEEDGWILIPYKVLPDDWNHAPDIHSLRSLDRSFVFPGEQVHVLACLSASNQETEIITPFKVAAVMCKNGKRKDAVRQNENMKGETNSVAGGEEVSHGVAVMNQNDENLEKEKIDPAKDVHDSESFIRMEDHRRQTETLLKMFNNSHFFVRIAEWDEPLWSRKSASQTASDSSEMDIKWSIGNETKNIAKSISSLTAVIDSGNFDANASGGVARGDLSIQTNDSHSFCLFGRMQDRNLCVNPDNLVYANRDPCGELLKWLLPVDNTLPPPRALSSPHLGPGSVIASPSHRFSHSASSGSQLFSFSNLRSYSMSSLPQSVHPPHGPIKTQSSKPSFDLDEMDHYSSQEILNSQSPGIEELLSFRGVSQERERFSVHCGLRGIHIPGRRWRKKLEIIQPIEIHSYAANCNTDDLLCVQIKNVSPAHIPDIVVYVDAITIVLEEASKDGPPASLPIACIEAGEDHSLPNLALRRGEEHSFILKPASSMWKNLKAYGEKSKSSGLKPLLKTFNRKGSPLTSIQYAIMVSCRCNYSESRLFLKKPINWRPRVSRDLMISVACETSGQYSGSSERSTQLPVQVLTLRASNLTPEDLTMTVLAPASFTSPPSVVSLNSYPTTPRSPFLGLSVFATIASSERHGSAMQRLGSMPTVSEIQKQTADARTRFTSFNGQLTPVADSISTSGLGCTHLWLQSRVPLGCVPAQSTATIKMELLPLTDGIITLDSLRIDVKEKESLEPRWISFLAEQKNEVALPTRPKNTTANDFLTVHATIRDADCGMEEKTMESKIISHLILYDNFSTLQFLFRKWGKFLAGILSLRVQQLDVRCETKTKDNVFVNVVASIQYRALSEKAQDAFYKLSNTRAQIQSYVFDVIRASVPKLELDAVFEQKNDIARAVEEELEKAMSHYGFEIVQTLIVDIEPDEHVKRAMNEINAAARLRVAANEKAEAEKILQIKRAEGDAESKYLAGLGIARQRQAIVDGLRDSVLAFSVNVPGTTSKDVMDMVLVTQYFDTMKEIGASSKSNSVFIPHGPGAVRDIASQIRDGLLQAGQSN